MGGMSKWQCDRVERSIEVEARRNCQRIRMARLSGYSAIERGETARGDYLNEYPVARSLEAIRQNGR